MKNVLKWLLLITVLLSSSNGATFQWDNPVDGTNIVQYHIYGRTNGIANTNYAKMATVIHPLNTATINLTAGVSQQFYAVSEDTSLIESEPSNLVDYFLPIGLPPTIIPQLTIATYSPSTKVWGGVKVAWQTVDSRYGVTNYVVNFVSSTMTNKYFTINNSYTLATLPLADYNVFVTAHNSLGESSVPASAIRTLNSRNPKKVYNLTVE